MLLVFIFSLKMNFPKSIKLENAFILMSSKLALSDFSINISVFSKDGDVSSIQNFMVTEADRKRLLQ